LALSDVACPGAGDTEGIEHLEQAPDRPWDRTTTRFKTIDGPGNVGVRAFISKCVTERGCSEVQFQPYFLEVCAFHGLPFGPHGPFTRGNVSTKRTKVSGVQMHASSLNENSKRSVTGRRNEACSPNSPKSRSRLRPLPHQRPGPSVPGHARDDPEAGARRGAAVIFTWNRFGRLGSPVNTRWPSCPAVKPCSSRRRLGALSRSRHGRAHGSRVLTPSWGRPG
jgi:hypothetical protein